ncbi:MAG: hypothetical protein KGS72_04285 [Cyanobacteria bacterium REEB67]|nr:hypothetical protein [Cyanobacteria bacterium REEB67]
MSEKFKIITSVILVVLLNIIGKEAYSLTDMHMWLAKVVLIGLFVGLSMWPIYRFLFTFKNAGGLAFGVGCGSGVGEIIASVVQN